MHRASQIDRRTRLLALLPFAAAFGCGGRSALEVKEGAASAAPTAAAAPSGSATARVTGFDAVFWGEAGAFGLRLGGKLESLDARAAYSWSPDHTQVAVAGADGRVSEIVSVSGARKPCDADAAPSWSPDSKRLAFSRRGKPFIADADCSNARSPDVSPKNSPIGPFISWSSDSRYAAFQYFMLQGPNGPSQSLNVYVVDAQLVTATETFGLTDALWSTVFFSPNARRIALAQSSGYVAVMPPSGPPDFLVEVDAGDGNGSWSFDSSHFAIGRTVIAADGSGSVSLDEASSANNGRRWSPSAFTLAYFARNSIAFWPPTGTLIQVSLEVTDLAWAPDGRHLAYQSTDPTSLGGVSVVVDPSDGAELLRIPSENLISLAGFAWNPSGSRLWATTDVRELRTANSDGSQARSIAKNVSSAVWLPDGDHIAFSDERAVFTVRADGSELKTVSKADSYINFLPL